MSDEKLNQDNLNEQQLKINAILMNRKFILIDGKTGQNLAEGITAQEATNMLEMSRTAFIKEYVREIIIEMAEAARQVADEKESKPSAQDPA